MLLVLPVMPAVIFDFFERYIESQRLFSANEIAAIKSLAIPKRLKKREYLLREGEVCRFHTFVCSGCLRSYRIDAGGNAHIFSLSPADHWLTDRVSLFTGTPSLEFIDALEDSAVIQLTADNFKTLLKNIPHFELLNMKIITDDCGRNRERIYMMLSQQAEERYRQFIRRFPQLHQRLPICMIASYLGISRETLTRIRGQMCYR